MIRKQIKSYEMLQKRMGKLSSLINEESSLEAQDRQSLLETFGEVESLLTKERQEWGIGSVTGFFINDEEANKVGARLADLENTFSQAKEGLGPFEQRRVMRRGIEERFKLLQDTPGINAQTLIAGGFAALSGKK